MPLDFGYLHSPLSYSLLVVGNSPYPLPGEYLPLYGAAISIRTGVVARTWWSVTGAVCESWPLGWLALIGARAVC